jgi:hypothetical protein
MWYALLGRAVWIVGKRVAKRKLGPGLALRAAGAVAVAAGALAGIARARRARSSSS